MHELLGISVCLHRYRYLVGEEERGEVTVRRYCVYFSTDSLNWHVIQIQDHTLCSGLSSVCHLPTVH